MESMSSVWFRCQLGCGVLLVNAASPLGFGQIYGIAGAQVQYMPQRVSVWAVGGKAYPLPVERASIHGRPRLGRFRKQEIMIHTRVQTKYQSPLQVTMSLRAVLSSGFQSGTCAAAARWRAWARPRRSHNRVDWRRMKRDRPLQIRRVAGRPKRKGIVNDTGSVLGHVHVGLHAAGAHVNVYAVARAPRCQGCLAGGEI